MTSPQPSLCILVPDPDNLLCRPMWPPQHRIIADALAEDGLVADTRPWTGDDDLSGYDLVLPLLAWGYHDDPALWRAQLDRWEAAGVRLANPPAVLRWNDDKSYLIDFAARGAPVIPSLLAPAASDADLAAARARFGDVDLIAKPTVSAGAEGLARIAPGGAFPQDLAGRRILFQPFQPTIATQGELSIFHFGGVYSHAVMKRPKPGDIRVQPLHGGREHPLDPPAQARAAAEAVLALVDEPLLYARIDLVPTEAGDWRLIELEITEPQLYLEYAPDHGAAFARAVRAAAG